MNKRLVFALCFLLGTPAFSSNKPILADASFLKALNIPIEAQQAQGPVAFAKITSEQEHEILENAHLFHKCGGFESLASLGISADKASATSLLAKLADIDRKNENYSHAPVRVLEMQKDPKIEAALKLVDEKNLLSTVQWLSSFPNRFNTGDQANDAVNAFRDRLTQLTAQAPFPIQIELIDHQSTAQKSIHLVIPGKSHPDESVVLGAHFDSINMQWGGGNAPGADDNASGAANLLEALRILMLQSQPERTVEFFWYAGEESGLLGSAEIAQNYKTQNKNVVAVLQLDMTLMPGEGLFTLASMSDFTSAWLRDYLKAANTAYLNVNVVEDQCGYGCSDHASWYRQGYPTLMPFEAKMETMNPNIHSPDDLITPKLSFQHSTVFTKIALILTMDLANSRLSQPY